jgi:23S rRNA (guanosine2251-2'-O)-methyltransferase
MQIEGRNPVLEALKSDQKVSIVYIQNNIVKSDKVRDIIRAANSKGIRVRKIGRNNLDKHSRTKSHQGVIAKVFYKFFSLNEVLEELSETKKQPFFVMMNNVLYQHNLGAIIRTAECAGCTGVIIPKTVKLTEDALRSSMGAANHIPVIKENLLNAIKILKSYDITVAGLEASGEETIYETNLAGPIAVLVGEEHSGITKSFLSKCDKVIKIPLFGKINSLNMSNAAAVTIFEKVRQELEKDK